MVRCWDKVGKVDEVDYSVLEIDWSLGEGCIDRLDSSWARGKGREGGKERKGEQEGRR